MGKKLDLTGQVFGYLTVLYEDGRISGGVAWRCRCRCGNEITTSSNHLRTERTKSCGCLNKERVREVATKHGLWKEYRRLYESVRHHFAIIKNGGCYRDWTIDERYTGEDGVARFCYDLIALQPEMCRVYEEDNSFDLDKDNSEVKVFCPECVRFIKSSENRSKRSNSLTLQDKTRFSVFCRAAGVRTREDGRATKDYTKYSQWLRKHNGEGHPELIKRANELIALYTKTLELLKLRDAVKEFASRISPSSH